jgi:hypothetical protein
MLQRRTRKIMFDAFIASGRAVQRLLPLASMLAAIGAAAPTSGR